MESMAIASADIRMGPSLEKARAPKPVKENGEKKATIRDVLSNVKIDARAKLQTAREWWNAKPTHRPVEGALTIPAPPLPAEKAPPKRDHLAELDARIKEVSKRDTEAEIRQRLAEIASGQRKDMLNATFMAIQGLPGKALPKNAQVVSALIPIAWMTANAVSLGLQMDQAGRSASELMNFATQSGVDFSTLTQMPVDQLVTGMKDSILHTTPQVVNAVKDTVLLAATGYSTLSDVAKLHGVESGLKTKGGKLGTQLVVADRLNSLVTPLMAMM